MGQAVGLSRVGGSPVTFAPGFRPFLTTPYIVSRSDNHTDNNSEKNTDNSKYGNTLVCIVPNLESC